MPLPKPTSQKTGGRAGTSDRLVILLGGFLGRARSGGTLVVVPAPRATTKVAPTG